MDSTTRKVESEVSHFIVRHINDRPDDLLLRCGKELEQAELKYAVVQLDCRQHTRRKLMKFNAFPDFRYPTLLASEQATNQAVSEYHASLIGTGRRIYDLTAGLGIDAFTMALNGNNVTAVELESDRYGCLVWNAEVLKDDIENKGGKLTVVNHNCIDWLKERGEEKADIIYIDPARRDISSNRVFKLSDCVPDVLGNYELLSSRADGLLIKASPLLDPVQTLREIPDLASIHLVCLRGECKEVLVAAGKIFSSDDKEIIAVDLEDEADGSFHIRSEWKCTPADISRSAMIASREEITPGTFLYDPNAAVHKIRAGKKLETDFRGILQAGRDTDLFISREFYPDFPGRIFRIESVPDKRELKSLKKRKGEIMVRNYPEKPETLRKKLGITSGDDIWIIGFRAGEQGNPTLVKCSRIS